MNNVHIQSGQTEQIRVTALDETGSFLSGLGTSSGTNYVLLEIRRESDGFYLDFADSTFKSSGWTTRQQDMTELNSTYSPGTYYYNWVSIPEGEYYIRATSVDSYNTPWESELKVGDFIDNIDATISSRSSHSADDIWTSDVTGIGRTLTDYGTLVSDITTAVWGAGTRTLTSFGTLIADIWSYVTRELTGIGSSGIASEANATTNTTNIISEIDNNETKIDTIISDIAALPTANEIADQVWDETLSGHLSSGSTGEALDNADSINSLDDIADAVWTYNGTGVGRTLTDFGSLVSDIATAVWSAGTRTLTSFGTLVSDIWTNVTRTLTGIGSSGIASEANATTNTSSIITEINANEVKIDSIITDLSAHRTAVEAKIIDILGLVQSNIIIDNQVYDSNDNLTSARIRIFPTSTDVTNQTNVINTYTMTAVYTSELLTSYKVTKN